VVAGLALGTAACGPGDSKDGAASTPSATPSTSAATTPATTAPATPTTPATPSAPAGGGVLTAAQFDTLVLPKPAKMPQDGAWADASSDPRIRQATYDAGGKSYLTVYMFDCRDPQYAHATEGYGAFCHMKPDTSVAGHPVWNPPGNDGTIRVVRAHNVYAYVETGVDGLATYDGPDLIAYIKSMDLSAMDRLG
jgi:hypothetical protein